MRVYMCIITIICFGESTMGISEAQKKATYKYRAKYEELRFRVTKEEKEAIKEFAKQRGQSVSEFVNEAVKEKMGTQK